MSLHHPDPYATLHDASDSTDIAMHCREMSRPMRCVEAHYSDDMDPREALAMRGPNVNRVTVQDAPKRTGRSAFLWPIAALCVLAAAAVAGWVAA